MCIYCETVIDTDCEPAPVQFEDPIQARRNEGDDMLYPTHDIFGRWED